MKAKISLLLLLNCLIICSCKKDSDGSYLTSASHINAFIDLTKSVDENGTISSNISVMIADAKGNSVEIQDGSVKVNDTALNVIKRIHNNSTFLIYTANNIIKKIEANRLYNFQIKLSDGTIYNSSITTQEKDLHELLMPNSQPRDSDLKLSWLEIDTANIMDVYFYTISNNDTTSLSIFEPIYGDILNGKYIIPKGELSNPLLNMVIVQVMSMKDGILDSRIGGKITSIFEIEKHCNLQ